MPFLLISSFGTGVICILDVAIEWPNPDSMIENLSHPFF